MRRGGTPGLAPEQGTLPGFGEAARLWLKMGLLSFGGPAGQIAMLHREVVEQRQWVGERRFLHALSYCALLPGPEAQQLAIYLGWLMHGTGGGVVAGTLFVLPGAFVLLLFSAAYALYGRVPLVGGVFFGLQCAVLAIVVQALLRLARRSLTTNGAWALAVGSVFALSVFALPFPVVMFGAAAIGVVFPGSVGVRGPVASGDLPGLVDQLLAGRPDIASARAIASRRACGVALGLWALPVFLVTWLAPGRFSQIAWFFSKMAVVTFGGAYAVLAYVAQDAVHAHHWLSPTEMLAGLGLAETTPGPLILVLQFVGFLAGFRAPGPLTGVWGGIAGSILTLWVTFVPCFLFVFLGAPVMERLTQSPILGAAFSAVTSAVVGVIANLALWFGLHVLFDQTIILHWGAAAFELPRIDSFSAPAGAVTGLAAVALFGLGWSVPRVLGLCAAAGMVLSMRL